MGFYLSLSCCASLAHALFPSLIINKLKTNVKKKNHKLEPEPESGNQILGPLILIPNSRRRRHALCGKLGSSEETAQRPPRRQGHSEYLSHAQTLRLCAPAPPQCLQLNALLGNKHVCSPTPESNPMQMICCRGAWEAHSVKCLTLDFSSGLDFTVHETEP